MTPFDVEMHVGRAYNEAMQHLPADAWACFLDHDVALTTREWYRQLQEAIVAFPEGSFTAVTNRIACSWQRAHETSPDNHDMRYHRQAGRVRLGNRHLLDVTDTMGWGGVLMCLSKRSWERAGGFVDRGLLCVDHQMHFALRDAGLRVYLLEGLYVYHWRRAFGDELPADAPKVECRCRGPEKTPTVRHLLGA
jgi:hypothetical protein